MSIIGSVCLTPLQTAPAVTNNTLSPAQIQTSAGVVAVLPESEEHLLLLLQDLG